MILLAMTNDTLELVLWVLACWKVADILLSFSSRSD